MAEKIPKNKSNIYFSKFKWINDFSAARNDILKKVDTDYWMWLDSDDYLENIQNISNLINYMNQNRIDIVFLTYHYNYDENGKVVNIYWRERVFKNSKDLIWTERVHETIKTLNDKANIVRSIDIIIKHIHRNKELDQLSAERNLKLLR